MTQRRILELAWMSAVTNWFHAQEAAEKYPEDELLEDRAQKWKNEEEELHRMLLEEESKR